MKRQALALAIALGILLPATQVRANDFSDSIKREAERAAQQSNRPAARGDNPYMLPGVILIGGGATLMLFGFLDTTSVTCTDKGGATSINVSCDSGHNNGLIVAGLAAMGAGGFLLWKGENGRSPELVTGPGRVAIRKRIRW